MTELDSQSTIAIVGAGQAGVQTAESLRQDGFKGRLVMVGDEPFIPYQRPPLSKKWITEADNTGSLAIRSAEALARRAIELKLNTPVNALMRELRELVLGTGESLRYDRLVLATGARPRVPQLPGSDLQGVLVLRGIAHSVAIKKAIRECASDHRPIVVVGGGFIGLEVAASARALGANVFVLESLPRLMSRVTAPLVSQAFDRLHRAHGVEITYGAQVTELVGHDDHVIAVRTLDGREYATGCVLLGVGVLPNDAIAAAAGITCNRGIVVDDCSRTSDPTVVAAGDCTARLLPDGSLLRLESVHAAIEQGKSAAAALMGRERRFSSTPWFWSDQYDVKFQIVGLSNNFDEVVTRGDPAHGPFSAFYFKEGRLIAVDAFNRVSDHMVSKRLLDRGISPTPSQCADGDFKLQSLLDDPPPAVTQTD